MRNYGILISALVLCLIIASGCKQNGNVSQSDIYDRALLYYRDKDYANALKLFTRLAQGGDVFAQGYLGIIYEYGKGVDKNPQKAAYWYTRSAEAGLSMSMTALGSMYRYGIGGERSCSKSLHWYEKAAKANDTVALYNLSYMYRNGICVDVDKSLGNSLMVRAADIDNEYGILCNALAHYIGVGREKDYSASRLFFEKIADEYNNPIAYFYLYRIYYFGLEVERDVDRALLLCRKSSHFGMPAADYSLAVEYFHGKYIKKDYKVAFHYAMKSEGTMPESAYLLGVMYEKGLGVAADIDEAKKWYRQAVDMGYEKAQKKMSNLQ